MANKIYVDLGLGWIFVVECILKGVNVDVDFAIFKSDNKHN